MKKMLKQNCKSHYIYKGAVDPFSSHNLISDYIVNNYFEKQTILDIGCHVGFLGKALFEKGWSGNLIGLDKEAEFLKEAKKNHYAKVILTDIENGKIKLKRKVDLIVVADVLEHLAKPEAFLNKMPLLLKKDAKIIVSLPNVCNIYLRLKVLFGDFTYASYGILDKEHRYFYTQKTAKELINRNGFEILEQTQTPLPLPVVFPVFSNHSPFFWIHKINKFISQIKPSLFAYQFIFVCQ